jgi:hypothetical protein
LKPAGLAVLLRGRDDRHEVDPAQHRTELLRPKEIAPGAPQVLEGVSTTDSGSITSRSTGRVPGLCQGLAAAADRRSRVNAKLPE